MLAVAAALLLANVTGLAADTGARRSIESQPLIRSVLWMGDSIAYDLAPGVVTALEQGGLRADVFAFAGVSLTGGAWGACWVVFVTAPPIRPDAVPAGWPENWVDLTGIAQRIAERHPGRALVADASAVWGSSFTDTSAAPRPR